jgi:CRISPR-associated endonuclease/helicase Cas3
VNFSSWFEKATGFPPYPYQERLATNEDLPALLSIPTGLGKTAGTALGWLWRRRFAAEPVRDATPRRLVICLPMRVLVEQTRNAVVGWLHRLNLLAGEAQIETDNVISYNPWHGPDDPAAVRVHLLMGGDIDLDWDEFPERDAVLIGTQDVLLSRALNRGYAMSRFRWPMAFGMLNNDCLWVMDEVQLMGSGLATTAQLHAFRNELGTLGPCQSLWTSATIEREWLDTVDMAGRVPNLGLLELDASDLDHERVSKLRNAPKPAHKSELACSSANKKRYPSELAALVREGHAANSLSLVIVNTVDRAVGVYEELKKKKPQAELLLLHSRFRPHEREEQVRRLTRTLPEPGRIVVSTQVVEAGVDLDARLLVTELAPWASMVQRFGRCNRQARRHDASVLWVDVDEKTSAPYEPADMAEARERLERYEDVGIARLAGEKLGFKHQSVLRRKDLLQLFDTTPDLTGNDLDISGFIREADDHDVQVFWREGIDEPGEDVPAPHRSELCRVPIGQFRAWLKGHTAWRWDILDRRWYTVRTDELFPGLRLLIPAEQGGYDPDKGWSPAARRSVGQVEAPRFGHHDAVDREAYSKRSWQSLEEHTQKVVEHAEAMLGHLMLPKDIQEVVLRACKLHDVGKAHWVFQRTMLGEPPAKEVDTIWAKSELTGTRHCRKGFRHELASALALLQQGEPDLLLFLVAGHHGRVRVILRSYPHEETPEDPQRRFALGIHDGDDLPPVSICGLSVPPTKLDLSVMELGEGPLGPSWTSRMLGLRDDPALGPFRLAYLEAVLRAADHRASEVSQ